MAVELFLGRDGKLRVNELAPRTHNSGHYTLDACATSQFEQQLRAVCGLPLGAVDLLRPAVMVNLLGDLWANGVPPWDVVLGHPQAALHLYGKAEARPGRKMGHFTVLGESAEAALRDARRLKAKLKEAVSPSFL
jgi:5-(carboxyamino)imidazole ribonucleotide synthase